MTKPKKNSERVTPFEAQEIIEQLNARGVSIAKIAAELGVSDIYASRLKKPGYWKQGYIPAKTGKSLRALLVRYFPEKKARAIVDYMSSLRSGDLYCIHSAREILEFHVKLVREGILQSAKKGVKVIYMFPNCERIFSFFSTPPLELAAFIPADLKIRYRFFMQTLLVEAKETGICTQKQLRNNVQVDEVDSPFLFSPWTKIVFYQYHQRGQASTKLVQQHFEFGPVTGQHSASSFDWICEDDQADAIAKGILASRRTTLEWD